MVSNSFGGHILEHIRSFINKVLSKAAIIYLFITLLVSAFCKFSNLSGTFEIGGLLLLFLFSLAIAWGFQLFDQKSLSYPLALLLHYGITVFSGYVAFSIIGRIGHETGMFIVISAVYAFLAIFASIIRHFLPKAPTSEEPKNKNTKKKEPYKKQFK